jgi:hypothetical protein
LDSGHERLQLVREGQPALFESADFVVECLQPLAGFGNLGRRQRLGQACFQCRALGAGRSQAFVDLGDFALDRLELVAALLAVLGACLRPSSRSRLASSSR